MVIRIKENKEQKDDNNDSNNPKSDRLHRNKSHAKCASLRL